jgi:hypothetical protein
MPPASRKRSRTANDDANAASEEAPTLLRSASEAVQLSQRSGLVALWEGGELCDVTVRCDGMDFPAHKVVLAAGSAYFRAQLL